MQTVLPFAVLTQAGRRVCFALHKLDVERPTGDFHVNHKRMPTEDAHLFVREPFGSAFKQVGRAAVVQTARGYSKRFLYVLLKYDRQESDLVQLFYRKLDRTIVWRCYVYRTKIKLRVY